MLEFRIEPPPPSEFHPPPLMLHFTAMLTIAAIWNISEPEGGDGMMACELSGSQGDGLVRMPAPPKTKEQKAGRQEYLPTEDVGDGVRCPYAVFFIRRSL